MENEKKGWVEGGGEDGVGGGWEAYAAGSISGHESVLLACVFLSARDAAAALPRPASPHPAPPRPAHTGKEDGCDDDMENNSNCHNGDDDDKKDNDHN